MLPLLASGFPGLRLPGACREKGPAYGPAGTRQAAGTPWGAGQRYQQVVMAAPRRHGHRYDRRAGQPAVRRPPDAAHGPASAPAPAGSG